MKKMFILIIVFAAAVWIGLLIQQHPGYALLTYGDWSIAMPLWLAVVGFFVAVLLCYVLLRLFHWLAHLPNKIKKWHKQRKQKDALQKTNKGMIYFIEGNSYRAEKYLQKAIDGLPQQIGNYILLAKIAHQQHDYSKRDQIFRKAIEKYVDAELAICIVQIHLQLEHQQYEQAQSILLGLRKRFPKNAVVLQLQADTYLHSADWQHLFEMLYLLNKYSKLPEEKLQQYEIKCAMGLLQLATNLEKNNEIWYQLPRKARVILEVFTQHVENLVRFGDHEHAEKLIRDYLKRHWYEPLLKVYSKLNIDLDYKLRTAEYWLKYHPDSIALLNLLGKIYLEKQLWGKARYYLEKSLEYKPQTEAYLLLGNLLEEQRDLQRALQTFKHGLDVSVNGNSVK